MDSFLVRVVSYALVIFLSSCAQLDRFPAGSCATGYSACLWPEYGF